MLGRAVNELHERCERSARLAIELAIECGEKLNLAKTQVPHGQWSRWIETNCPNLSQRVAQGYMRLANHREKLEASNTKPDSYLTIKESLRLIASPRPSDPDIFDIKGPLPNPGEALIGKHIDDEIGLVLVTITGDEDPDFASYEILFSRRTTFHTDGDKSQSRRPFSKEYVHLALKLAWEKYSPSNFKWSTEVIETNNGDF